MRRAPAPLPHALIALLLVGSSCGKSAPPSPDAPAPPSGPARPAPKPRPMPEGATKPVVCPDRMVLDPGGGCAGWTAYGNLDGERLSGALTDVGEGRVLLTGGLASFESKRAEASAQVYDTVRQTAEPPTVLRHARMYHAAVRIGDEVLLLGGASAFDWKDEDNPVTLAGTWEIIGLDGVSRAAAPLAEPRLGLGAVRLDDGSVLFGGGGSLDLTSEHKTRSRAEVWRFDPKNRQIALDTPLPEAYTALWLPHQDGKGARSLGQTDTEPRAWRHHIYDAASRTWTPAPTPPGPTFSFFPANLPDGSLVVLEQLAPQDEKATRGFRLPPGGDAWQPFDTAPLEGDLARLFELPEGEPVALVALLRDERMFAYEAAGGRWLPWQSAPSFAIGGLALPGRLFLNLSKAGPAIYDTATGRPASAPGKRGWFSDLIARTPTGLYLLQQDRDQGKPLGLSALSYDVQTGLWSAATAPEHTLDIGGLVALGDGRLLAIGKEGSAIAGPPYDTWESRAPHPLEAKLHINAFALPDGGAFALLDDKIPLRYDAKADTWDKVELPYAVSGDLPRINMILADEGHVLVTGPTPPRRYDLATRKWADTAHFEGERREQHATTRLPDGRVLLTGGMSLPGRDFLRDTWLYDPKADTWTAGPEVPDMLWDHPLLALDDGRVLTLDRRHKALVLDLKIQRWELTLGAPFETKGDVALVPIPGGRVFLWSRGGAAIFRYAALPDPPSRTRLGSPGRGDPLEGVRAATNRARCQAQNKAGCELMAAPIKPHVTLPPVFQPSTASRPLAPGLRFAHGQTTSYRVQMDLAIDQKPGADIVVAAQMDLAQRVLEKTAEGGARVQVAIERQTGSLFAELVGNKVMPLPSTLSSATLELAPDGRVVEVDLDASQSPEAQAMVRQLSRALRSLNAAGLVSEETPVGAKWSVPIETTVELDRPADAKGDQPRVETTLNVSGTARYRFRGWRTDHLDAELAWIDVDIEIDGRGVGRSDDFATGIGQVMRSKGAVYWDPRRSEPAYAALYSNAVQTVGDGDGRTVILARLFMTRTEGD